nr:3'-5' exonuclease [Deinococcus humi]
MFSEELASLEADTLADAQQEWRKAVKRFRHWADDPRLLIVGTQTTGLTGQVVEIAVVTLDGTPLVDTLVRATVPIEPGAHRIHGLTDADLRDAPAWPEVMELLKPVLQGRLCLAYNAEFDRRACATSNAAHGMYNALSDRQYWLCAMTAYASIGWAWSDRRGEWRWTSLRNACFEQGVAPEADTHRALGGAQALARLVSKLSSMPPNPPTTLPEGMAITTENVGWTPEEHPSW